MTATRHPARACLLCVHLVVLGGCASREPVDSAADDPAEQVNRTVFAGNQAVDRNVLKPVAQGYRDNVPSPVRRSVGNFVANLSEPKVLVNDLLQGNTSRAWNTTQRFAVNTTAGVAGLFDVATDLGRPAHQADFGQTLGVWGAGPGSAVQLPLFGPSNVRDTAGLAVDFLTNPLSFVPGQAMASVSLGAAGAGVVHGRADILEATDRLEEGALDYYATLRSVQDQRRTAAVADGIKGDVVASAAAGATRQMPEITLAPRP